MLDILPTSFLKVIHRVGDRAPGPIRNWTRPLRVRVWEQLWHRRVEAVLNERRS